MGRPYKTDKQYFPCPCCGYRVHKVACSTASCPICVWEDSAEQLRNPYKVCKPNQVSLIVAQKNYQATGVSDPSRQAYANQPKADDIADNLWRPIDESIDNFGPPTGDVILKS